MKQYPDYKPASISWLDEIPSHWDSIIIKRKYSVVLGKMLCSEPRDESDTYESYLKAGSIRPEGIDTTGLPKMWFSEVEKKRLKLHDGDLVVSEGGDVGRSAIWSDEGIDCYIQNAVNRVRGVSKYSNKYLYYWICTIKGGGLIDVICNKSTIAHYTAEKLNSTECLLPPLEEQEAISQFLDRQTSHIDHLIAEKKNFINLLKEKRQALISHVVTKGLDPDVEMKDSGVEWIGEIPSHWNLIIVKRKYSITLGKMLCNEPRDEFDSLENYLKAGTIQPSGIRTKNLPKMWFSENEKKRLRLVIGDLVVSEGGDVGRCAIWNDPNTECYLQNAVLRARGESATNNKYLYYWLNTIKSDGLIDIICNKSTISHYTAEKLSSTECLFPPDDEQFKIVSFLDKETMKIDSLVTETETSIKLLKERRSALIGAAVTGKIDLRDQIK